MNRLNKGMNEQKLLSIISALGSRDKKVLGACWSASLAESVSAMSLRDLISKNKMENK